MEEKKEKRLDKKNINLRSGLTFFVVGVLLLLAYFLLNNLEGIGNAISFINGILTPFYLGFVFAFLLCPVFNKVTNVFLKLFSKGKEEVGKAYRLSKLISTLISVIIILIIVVGLLLLIIPEIVSTISDMLPKIEPAFNTATIWITDQLDKYPEMVEILSKQMGNLSETIVEFVKNSVLPHMDNLLSIVTVGVKGAVMVVINFFIAVITCIYFLNGKETFLAQVKKIVLSIFSKENAEKVLEFGTIANTQFSSFIIGKIISSIIVGFSCFFLMLILKIPYAAFISVIVGVTNVIPFFGPFIGAIPSALILIFESPSGCLKFIIMILILQQIDGNILTPQIVGKKTKLGGFWVMFAIVVGGGFFGFIGMIVGVPVFAIIYVYAARFVDNRLRKKELETDTFYYEDYRKYDNGTGIIKKSKRSEKKEKEKKDSIELSNKLKDIFTKKNDK